MQDRTLIGGLKRIQQDGKLLRNGRPVDLANAIKFLEAKRHITDPSTPGFVRPVYPKLKDEKDLLKATRQGLVWKGLANYAPN